MNFGTDAFEKKLAMWLPFLTTACFAVMLLSLKFDFLDEFFITTWHGRLGFDYFSVPRAFLNLTDGISIFDTNAGRYGPYASWYPYHPSLAVWLGFFLSRFAPWTSYMVFVAMSGLMLFACAHLLGRFTQNTAVRRAGYFILLCAPSVYLMLWCGQMHVFTVVALTLIIADLMDLLFTDNKKWTLRVGRREIRPLLFGGILLSLLSKPMLLLIIPALFAVPLYRFSLVSAGVIYTVISATFLMVPWLNPQGLGFDPLIDAIINPKLMLFTETIHGFTYYTYRPEFVSDNAVHWLNMKVRSGMFDAGHMEFFELSSFWAHLTGITLPQAVYMLPVYAMLAFSIECYRIKDIGKRLACVLAACALGVLCFYVSYSVVYEYHFTTLLPLIFTMLIIAYSDRGRELFGRTGPVLFCLGGALLFAPTSYHWFINQAYGFHRPELGLYPPKYIPIFLSGMVYDWALDYIRVMRAVPVMIMLAGLAAVCWHTFRRGISKESL